MTNPNDQWYFKAWFIILMLIIIPPVGILFAVLQPEWDWVIKLFAVLFGLLMVSGILALSVGIPAALN